jgi:hypothetical protein
VNIRRNRLAILPLGLLLLWTLLGSFVPGSVCVDDAGCCCATEVAGCCDSDALPANEPDECCISIETYFCLPVYSPESQDLACIGVDQLNGEVLNFSSSFREGDGALHKPSIHKPPDRAGQTRRIDVLRI